MTRLVMVVLGKFFDWRSALVIVKPETFIRWHRTAFRGFWRWKSRKRGRPALPRNIRALIQEMARGNHTWGQERIANELNLKLGIKVSARTVQKYLRKERPRGTSGQRWNTFVRNHAKAIVACDFLAVVTVNLHPIRILGDGGRLSSNLTFERDRASDCGMDDATTPRVSCL